MTLYLKYRPQTIEELDLEIVRKQFRELVAFENIPHAFLFSGPRGSGKTSAARILAKLINCEKPAKTKNGLEPCNTCDHCKAISSGRSMDVMELDTASNRGIDDIRAIRENVNLSPASAKKKIYIMDEAHMLTLEAANAFLKTLEEPPAHAIFILATTDPAKLPETVRSRLTMVQFQKANEAEITRGLSRIIKGENLKVEKGVLELVAARADGSLRDAVKMFESLTLSGTEITKQKAGEVLFSTNLINLPKLLELIFAKETKEVLAMVKDYVDSGGSVRELINMLQKELRIKLLAGENQTEVMALLKLLMEARGNIVRAFTDELPLELALIEWMGEVRVPKKKAPETTQHGSDLTPEAWTKILTETRSKNVSLEALLRTARPVGVDGNTVSVVVYYRFHKERLEAEQYRSMFERVVGEVLGLVNPRVICTLEDPPNSLTRTSEADIIKAAEEIFGE